MKYTVILDSGHAFNTPGKRNEKEKFYEYDFNNKIQYLIAELLKSYPLIKVVMTNPYPHTTKDISLSNRCNIANKYYDKDNKQLFISIHANAFDDPKARGTETYHAPVCSENSKKFAKIVNDNVFNVFKCYDSNALNRGVKTANFTVIKNTKMPAVLIEFGFYTNINDLDILRKRQTELATAVVRSIVQYFKLEEKPIINVNKEVHNTLYRVCVGSYKNRDNAEELRKELKSKGFDSFIIIENN